MPARKPSIINTRHDTKDEAQARTDAESALSPRQKLPEGEPAALKEHKLAGAEWRRLMRLYNSLDGVIVTALDTNMLLDHCILVEQLAELDEMRAAAMIAWRVANTSLADYHKRLERGGTDDESMKTLAKLTDACNWAYKNIISLDGRADRKRALLLTLRQSLYLTPRSRAGVAPPGKPPEDPGGDSPMKQLLDE